MENECKNMHGERIKIIYGYLTVKVKLTLEQATMAQTGSRPRPRMGVVGQRHSPAPLPPGKTPAPIV